MALLQNITLNAQYPLSLSGGATGNERSQFGQRLLTHINKYCGVAGLDGSVPPGYVPPYAWGMSIGNFTLSTITINAGVVTLKIVVRPVTVTIHTVFIPVSSTPGKLKLINLTGSGPKVHLAGAAPKIRFTGTRGE